jgi:hypothetical protein
MEAQKDIRGRVASILSIEPDSDSGLLDLTAFLDKDDFVGQGGFGEVYRTKWLNKVSVEQVQRLPRLAIKVMRAVPLRDQTAKKKREKVIASYCPWNILDSCSMSVPQKRNETIERSSSSQYLILDWICSTRE